jgi:hypothetical protein
MKPLDLCDNWSLNVWETWTSTIEAPQIQHQFLNFRTELPHSFRIIHVLAPDLAAEAVLQWILGQTNAMYMNQFTISTILAIPPPESCHSPCNRLTSFRCFNSTLELDGSVAGTHRGGIRRHHPQTYHWMGYVTIETGMSWGTPFSIKTILYMLQYDYWPDLGQFWLLEHSLPMRFLYFCFLSQTYFIKHLTPKIPNPPIIIPYVYYCIFNPWKETMFNRYIIIHLHMEHFPELPTMAPRLAWHPWIRPPNPCLPTSAFFTHTKADWSNIHIVPTASLWALNDNFSGLKLQQLGTASEQNNPFPLILTPPNNKHLG